MTIGDWIALLGAGLTFLGILNTWALFIIRSLRSDIGTLQEADAKVANDISELRILVAGDYVKRTEFADALKEVNREFREALQQQTQTLLAALGK